MMDVVTFLEHIRDHYISAYEQVAVKHRKENNPSISEGLIELPNKGEVPYAFRLWRVDLASNVNGKPSFSEFNHDSHLQFTPFKFTYSEQLTVSMNPVSWNGVEFEYSDSGIDISTIEDWALRWIDVDGHGIENKSSFLGYIHNITYPECKDGSCTFSVDFGSASTQSLFELLDVLVRNNVENVTIHSRTALGQS